MVSNLTLMQNLHRAAHKHDGAAAFRYLRSEVTTTLATK